MKIEIEWEPGVDGIWARSRINGVYICTLGTMKDKMRDIHINKLRKFLANISDEVPSKEEVEI